MKKTEALCVVCFINYLRGDLDVKKNTYHIMSWNTAQDLRDSAKQTYNLLTT